MAPIAQPFSRAPVKSFEVLLYALRVWDFPWPLTGPPISSRRAAPPQLPVLGLLGPGMQGREGDGGQRLPAQEVVLCMPRSVPPLPHLPTLTHCLEFSEEDPDSVLPCLPSWGEPLSFSQPSLAAFALASPLSHWDFFFFFFFVLCLIKLLEYCDIFEIEPLEDSGPSYLTHPCPTLPHPTCLLPLF